MSDILKEWKDSRFVIPDVEITAGVTCAVLTDISFWVNHADELVEWCQDRNCKHTGMVVEFLDEVTMVEFLLRWS